MQPQSFEPNIKRLLFTNGRRLCRATIKQQKARWILIGANLPTSPGTSTTHKTVSLSFDPGGGQEVFGCLGACLMVFMETDSARGLALGIWSSEVSPNKSSPASSRDTNLKAQQTGPGYCRVFGKRWCQASPGKNSSCRVLVRCLCVRKLGQEQKGGNTATALGNACHWGRWWELVLLKMGWLHAELGHDKNTVTRRMPRRTTISVITDSFSEFRQSTEPTTTIGFSGLRLWEFESKIFESTLNLC